MKYLSCLFIFSSLLVAQPAQRLIYVTTDPSGSCVNGAAIQWNPISGNLFGCVAGTWTKLNGTNSSGTTYTTVSFSATPIFTVTTSTSIQNFQITLTGNVTSSTLVMGSATTGQDIAFKICQDATGNRTFTWPTNVINPGSIPTVASICGKQIFRFDGTNVVAFGGMILDGTTPGIQTSTGFLTLPTAPDTIVGTGATQVLSNKTFVAPALGNIASGNGANLTNLGNAATATALAATPALCSTGQAPTGILASGNATGCAPLGGTGTPAVGNTTPVTVSANTTADQALMELALPASLLNSLSTPYLAHSSGIFTIAALQTPNLTYKAKLCTVSGCGSGTVITLASITTTATVAATNNIWVLNLKIATTAIGTSGTVLTHGSLAINIGASSSVADSVFNDANTAASSAINLTAALFLDFTVSTGPAGNAGNSFTQQIGTLEPASSQGPAGINGTSGAMIQIAQTILGSPVASVTFGSIPGTYTNLRLTIIARSAAVTNGDNVIVTLNTDTSANYNVQFNLIQNVSSTFAQAIGVVPASASPSTVPGANSPANVAAVIQVDFIGYATAFFKGAIFETGLRGNTSGAGFIETTWFGWNSTATINSIVFSLASSGNFVAGSVFTLYGIT